MLALKAIVVWLIILVLAIANGAVREKWLIPALGARVALPLSGVMLASLAVLATWLALPWFGRLDTRQSLLMGLCWLCMTVAFEFLFGRYVMGKQWRELLKAYSFANGDIWPLVLLAIAAAPYLAMRLRA